MNTDQCKFKKNALSVFIRAIRRKAFRVPKINTDPITDVTDVAKMVTGVEKVIKILGLAPYLKI